MKNSLNALRQAKNQLLYDKGEAELEVSVVRDMIPDDPALKRVAEQACAAAHARRNLDLVRTGAIRSVRFIMNMKARGLVDYGDLVKNPDYIDFCHQKNVRRATECLELCRQNMYLAGEPDAAALADLGDSLEYEITLEEIGTDENEMRFFRMNAECSRAKKFLADWQEHPTAQNWLFLYQKSLSVISLFSLKPESFFERLEMSDEEIQKFKGE